MGRLATKLDEYASLPSVDSLEETKTPESPLLPPVQEEGDDEPQYGRLAALAEKTRSQLLEAKPSQQASASFASEDRCTECSEDVTDATSVAPSRKASRRPASAGTARRMHGSMMTHPPSAISNAAGRGAVRDHTFGSTPRVSPSGTMAHHSSQTPETAAVGVRRPSSAAAGRTRPASASSRASSRPASASSRSREAAGRGGAAKGAEPLGPADENRQPANRPPRPSAPAYEPPPFGSNAKGAVAMRRPSSGRREPRDQPRARPFEIVDCCGDEFDGYCCRRHHPDDAVVCCERHDPMRRAITARSAMGGRAGAGHGPAFSMPRTERRTAIGDLPRGNGRADGEPRRAGVRPEWFV